MKNKVEEGCDEVCSRSGMEVSTKNQNFHFALICVQATSYKMETSLSPLGTSSKAKAKGRE